MQPSGPRSSHEPSEAPRQQVWRGARFALRVRAVERPSFWPAFTVKTASYNKSLLVSRTSALGERHIEKLSSYEAVRRRMILGTFSSPRAQAHQIVMRNQQRSGAMVRDKTRPKPHRSERQYKWTRNYVLIFPIVPQSLSYLLEFPVCAQDDPDPESYFYGHTRD